MQKILISLARKSLPNPQKNLINTTLYELIEAVEEEVQNKEQGLVSEIIIDLLKTYPSNCRIH